MLYASPSLALVGGGVVPCVAGMAVVYGRYLRNITKQMMDKVREKKILRTFKFNHLLACRGDESRRRANGKYKNSENF